MFQISGHDGMDTITLGIQIDATRGQLTVDTQRGLIWKKQGEEDRFLPWSVFFGVTDGCEVSYRDDCWTIVDGQDSPTVPNSAIRKSPSR